MTDTTREIIKKLRAGKFYCTGYKAGAKFPEHMKIDALANIKKARTYINNELSKVNYDDTNWSCVCGNCLSRGERYNDNDLVLSRMASTLDKYPEPVDLFRLAFDALIDSADADYWYTFEKEW